MFLIRGVEIQYSGQNHKYNQWVVEKVHKDWHYNNLYDMINFYFELSGTFPIVKITAYNIMGGSYGNLKYRNTNDFFPKIPFYRKIFRQIPMKTLFIFFCKFTEANPEYSY